MERGLFLGSRGPPGATLLRDPTLFWPRRRRPLARGVLEPGPRGRLVPRLISAIRPRRRRHIGHLAEGDPRVALLGRQRVRGRDDAGADGVADAQIGSAHG